MKRTGSGVGGELRAFDKGNVNDNDDKRHSRGLFSKTTCSLTTKHCVAWDERSNLSKANRAKLVQREQSEAKPRGAMR